MNLDVRKAELKYRYEHLGSSLVHLGKSSEQKNEHSRRSSRNPLSTMISLLLDHARRSAIALPFSLQQRVLRMLGSPQGGSGVSSSALQRQIAHATCAYGFHCQFKVVPTKQCECGNRFHTQCLSLSFQDAETQVDGQVNMHQCNLDSCSLQHAGQNADEDSPAKRTREKKGALNAEHKKFGARALRGEACNTCTCRNVWCMRPLKFRSRTLKETACVTKVL